MTRRPDCEILGRPRRSIQKYASSAIGQPAVAVRGCAVAVAHIGQPRAVNIAYTTNSTADGVIRPVITVIWPYVCFYPRNMVLNTG